VTLFLFTATLSEARQPSQSQRPSRLAPACSLGSRPKRKGAYDTAKRLGSKKLAYPHAQGCDTAPNEGFSKGTLLYWANKRDSTLPPIAFTIQ
jgi:hypothetical protein